MMREKLLNRRRFIKDTATGSAGLIFCTSLPISPFENGVWMKRDIKPLSTSTLQENLDLHPAKWIWYPSGRCLQNTFIFFRREVVLDDSPVETKGWILGESRYVLFVNGKRIQWGPAPCDPRYSEADPLDLVKKNLKKGRNIIAVQCLFYGQGDGTWPIGKPGLIAKLDIKMREGRTVQVVTDEKWNVKIATAWRPGNYKRWYLRSLQEERDERLYPNGWNDKKFSPDEAWHSAMICGTKASKPAICNEYPSYDYEISGSDSESFLRARSVPFMKETKFPAKQLKDSIWLSWKVPVKEYFDFKTPEAFRIIKKASAEKINGNEWLVKSKDDANALMTFEWEEQGVGWPYFYIKASAGTVVELLVQEAHDLNGPALMNFHFNSWSRFICKEGWNYFETMDFESFRWMQLHIRNSIGDVRIKNVGMRRRKYPWKERPVVICNNEYINKVIGASINTLNNCAQDTIVDGMARERQQYSGDGSLQLFAIYNTMGVTDLPARFVNTFGQGLMLGGYFFDSWPAYDRLARTMERQLNLTNWGPILDHSVGFCLDCWNYYLYTGDLGALSETFPRLITFFKYLKSIRVSSGLLSVNNLGLPSVWMDHNAYSYQRQKQCAFNLFVSAMCTHGLAPLCKAFKEPTIETEVEQFGSEILQAATTHFWSKKHRAFVNDLPWKGGNEEPHFDDRALATSILFDQCPDKRTEETIKLLKEVPSNMGLSYPANAIWRLWALAKGAEVQTVIDELQTRWYGMESVLLNNTIQEGWHAQPDSGSQWSHCAVGPLIIMHMGIAGIRPLTTGYALCEIRPQFGELEMVNINTYTVKGPIKLKMEGKRGSRHVRLFIPAGIIARFVVDTQEILHVSEVIQNESNKEYILQGGQTFNFLLRYT